MLARKKVKVWNRGQVTIPKSIRENLGIEDDAVLNMVQMGKAIFLTPRELQTPKPAMEFQAIIKENNISEEDLMLALKETRKRLSEEAVSQLSFGRFSAQYIGGSFKKCLYIVGCN